MLPTEFRTQAKVLTDEVLLQLRRGGGHELRVQPVVYSLSPALGLHHIEVRLQRVLLVLLFRERGLQLVDRRERVRAVAFAWLATAPGGDGSLELTAVRCRALRVRKQHDVTG